MNPRDFLVYRYNKKNCGAYFGKQTQLTFHVTSWPFFPHVMKETTQLPVGSKFVYVKLKLSPYQRAMLRKGMR